MERRLQLKGIGKLGLDQGQVQSKRQFRLSNLSSLLAFDAISWMWGFQEESLVISMPRSFSLKRK